MKMKKYAIPIVPSIANKMAMNTIADKNDFYIHNFSF